MTITAKILADSVSVLPNGKRLTTWELTYPRIIHAEFMTHRVFSRNAASSRAIPLAKATDRIRQDPFIPSYWGKNQSGMQAKAALDASQVHSCEVIWKKATENALYWAEELGRVGLHKQIASRVLEPFSHITVIASATDTTNFFALRYHEDAEPHFQDLARAMFESLQASQPKPLFVGDWHLPLVSEKEVEKVGLALAIKCSVARCARVSYLNHDGSAPKLESDLRLHDLLKANGHFSPFEHQARPMDMLGGPPSNLLGWVQYRKLCANENAMQFAPPTQHGHPL